MENKRILFILAHPDDESFGPGGTIAKYAAEGTDVHVAIATDGAAGSVAEGYENARTQLVAVRAKELEAAVSILGATLHHLGYRDSGMQGDPANQHPDAFIQADETEAIGRVVRLIRELRPQVIITHDETGGYFHPDHIMCWQVVTPAFYAAADPEQFVEIGLPPHRPQHLYYTAFPKKWVRYRIWMLRLRGEDPSRAGRNKDINLLQLGMPSEMLHTVINTRPYWDVKKRASAEHASQGGGTSFARLIPSWLHKYIFGKEYFMRAYPPAPVGLKENDFFADIIQEETVATVS